MEEQLFEARKNSFFHHVLQKQTKTREEYAKKLRKTHKANLIQFKRIRNSRVVEYETRLNTFKSIISAANTLLTSKDSIYIAIKYIRQCTLYNNETSTEEILRLNIVPSIIGLLKSEERVALEAAWVLANIAADKGAQKIYECEGHIEIMSIITYASVELQESCLWALGNLAGDSIFLRDKLLNMGIIELIMKLLNKDKIKLSLLRTICWTSANLCRGTPLADITILSPYIDLVCEFLTDIKDQEVLNHSVYSLLYVAKCSYNKIITIEKKLIKMLDDENLSEETKKLVLKIINRIISQMSKTALIELISVLKELIKSNTSTLRLCFSIIGNIATEGESIHIESIIENKLIEIMCNSLINHSTDLHSQFTLARTFTAICGGASERQIESIVNAGGIEVLVNILKGKNIELIMEGLFGIEEILIAGEVQSEYKDGINEYAVKFDSIGGLRVLELLILHSNSKVSKKSQDILSEYFYFQEHQYNRTNKE